MKFSLIFSASAREETTTDADIISSVISEILILTRYLPASVSVIEYYAFSNCVNLASVTFKNPYYWTVTHFNDSDDVCDIPETDLMNPAYAATYLNSMYCEYDWGC